MIKNKTLYTTTFYNINFTNKYYYSSSKGKKRNEHPIYKNKTKESIVELENQINKHSNTQIEQKEKVEKDFNIYNVLNKENKKNDLFKSMPRLKNKPTINNDNNDNNNYSETSNINQLSPSSTSPILPNFQSQNNSIKKKTQLMRDFIQESLYNKDYGYFQTKEVIIPSDIETPHLSTFANFKEYTNYLHYIYKSLEHAWLTPVEIFKPYYSWSISNYIIEKFKEIQSTTTTTTTTQPNGKLKIYEIGAGSGTNALNILNHIRDNHKEIYDCMEYKIIEISKPLAQKQLTRIKQSHPKLNINITNANILEWNQTQENDECFIILTEVIDNLPHDKITITSNGIFESIVDSTVFETVKGKENIIQKKQISGFHREDSRPLTDPIIKEYLEYEKSIINGSSSSPSSSISIMLNNLINFYKVNIKSFFKGDESKYLPTVCFKLFQIFAHYFPRHHIILADFDELPSLVSGENAPTVQEKIPITTGEIDNPYHIPGSNKRGYQSIEREEILVQPGSCDIFFPHDWKNLHNMYCYTNKDRPNFQSSQVVSLKHKSFIKKYGSNYLDKTKTKSRYNPMISDYSNMSFLLS
ncbi:hypothetical protein ACTA71_005547 [Dictyostelium dimigraforme]